MKNPTRLYSLSLFLICLLAAVEGRGQATLPVSRTTWNAGAPTGWTDGNATTPAYTSTFACSGSNGGRLDNSAEYYLVNFSSSPDQLAYTLKISGSASSSCLVEESADGATWSTLVNHTSLPTTCTGYNYTLASGTRYVRWTYTKVAQNLTIDDVSITAGVSSAPEINIKQSSTNIASGGTHNFGSAETGTNNDVIFTIENTGNATLNVTTPLSNSGDYSILAQPASSVAASGTTTFTVRFTPTALGTRTGSVTITNDDSNEGSYVVNFTGTGTGSQQSVVTAVASSEANTISSLNNIATIADNTQGAQVWQFRLYDGNGSANDGDGLPTIYTGFTINMGAGNTVTNWSNAIQSARFFEDANASPVAGTVTVGSTNIIFTPTTPITVNDGAASNKLISLRLSLKNPLPANSDGLKFVFQLQQSNVSVELPATSSQLASFSNQISDNTKNVIEVLATQLVYTSIPSSAPLNNNFSVYVEARDANGNLDNGNTTSVTLAKTVGAGTFTVTSATKNLVAGAANWTDANHNTAETITLVTSGSGLTSASANVTIINAPYQLFDDFDRTSSSAVGIPSSGGLASWSESENNAGGCINSSPANRDKIRVSNYQLELSNCYEGNTNSCGSTVSQQIAFDMNGKYATTFNTASSTMEWYLNIRQSRPDPSGFAGYAAAFILGSTESNFASGTAQGYALTIGNTSTPDPIRLVSFNGQVSNQSFIITGVGDGADVIDNYLSVKVTFTPSTNTWGLYVRNDAGSFADPTTISVSGATATNSTYTNLNLRYSGAYWKHSSSCEEILLIDNVNIPVATSSAAEIKVDYTTNGPLEITDGGSFDFGLLNTASGSFTATFTITNQGTADLTLGTVGVSGGNAGDFSVTQPGSATLAPSATTTFTVTFDPSATGSRTTTLSFSNNDADENPFNFTLNGEGVTQMPVINEFVADHIGTDDREFIEVFGDVATDYSNMTLLVLEGDAVNRGVIDNVISVGTTDAAGYWWTGYLNSLIENGTITVLLVMNFSGSLNQDLDANNDGTLDVTPWTRVVDDVALRVSGGDATYSTTIISPSFDGFFLTPGGASRIANGLDTDNISNWMRNDADGWGLAGYLGTANANEAKNTPKRVNVRFNVWLGTTTIWTNAANWTVRVPNDTTEALIPTIGSSTYPNITGIVTYDCNGLYFSSTASNITIGAGAEIRNYGNFESFSNSTSFGAGTISFTGNFENTISGSFTIGELAINNPNSATIASGTVINITDKLSLQAGLLSNSGTINLKSSATNTAYIDDFSGAYSGTINGNVTLERYIPPTAGSNIFHYIGGASSATAGTKWGDDFNMGVSGTNGFVTPLDCNPASPALAQGSNYGGFFTYNESNVTDCYLTGWKVENSTYTIAPGKGIAARIANGIVLDETGTYPNPVADVTVSNLTKTMSNIRTYSRGYNLVANPFYAPLDVAGIIDDLTNDPESDWDGNIYIYNPSSGSYSAYNFLSSNPSTISTNQGFFIRAADAINSSTTTLDFIFNKSRRVAGSNTAFYRQPQQYAYGLNIAVENNGKTDATIIAFDETFTNVFDNGYDAMKLYNDAGIPSLYSKSADDPRAIHALPLLSDSTRSIPLCILITASGTHTFTFSGMEDFPATSLLWLEDLQTGMFHDLRQNPTYAFNGNVNDSNDRFMLHFTAPILTSATAATCVGNDGEISLQLPAGVEWSFIVKNDADAIVARNTGNGGTLVLNSLPLGDYTITFIYDGNYSVTETLTVAGLQQVMADFTSSVNNVFEGEEIQFTNNSSGATTYEWDFGDGTTVSGIAEPTHIYSAEGTYTVTLRATNDDCEASFTQQIVVSKQPTVGVDNPDENKLFVFAHEGAVYVQFEFQQTEVAEVKITNLLGQEILKRNVPAKGIHFFNLNDVESQYLLVIVKTSSVFETKKIYLR